MIESRPLFCIAVKNKDAIMREIRQPGGNDVDGAISPIQTRIWDTLPIARCGSVELDAKQRATIRHNLPGKTCAEH
jgi:hypothetical protein